MRDTGFPGGAPTRGWNSGRVREHPPPQPGNLERMTPSGEDRTGGPQGRELRHSPHRHPKRHTCLSAATSHAQVHARVPPATRCRERPIQPPRRGFTAPGSLCPLQGALPGGREDPERSAGAPSPPTRQAPSRGRSPACPSPPPTQRLQAQPNFRLRGCVSASFSWHLPN